MSIPRTQFCLALFLFLITAAGLFAQATAPTLKGQLADPSGAAIPDGTITATSDTGKVTVAQTDRAGNFLMILSTGTFTVRGMAKGFAPFEKSGIKIEGSSPVTINAQLKIASETQEITVSDQVQVTTDPASNVGQLVLHGADLEALPDDPDDLAADLQALAGPAAAPMADRSSSTVSRAASCRQSLLSGRSASTPILLQRSMTGSALAVSKSSPSPAPTNSTGRPS
jgi:hypothetical protein